MFKAIFWDNDGTLVDTEPLFFAATKEILVKNGVDLTEEFYVDQCLKRNASAFSLLDSKMFNIEMLRAERNRLYMNALKREVPLRDGIEETLAFFHKKLLMAVVTSSRKDHFEQIMLSSNLRKYFDFVIAAEDVTRHKPHPEPYLKALEISGLNPKKCLAIEDTERGVTSAKAAGLTCFAIPTLLTKGNDFSKADKVLENVRELMELV